MKSRTPYSRVVAAVGDAEVGSSRLSRRCVAGFADEARSSIYNQLDAELP